MKKLFFAVVVISLVSCGGGGSFTTESGKEVFYYKKGKEGAPSDSLITYFTLKYTTEKGGILWETTAENPSPIKVDSTFKKNPGEFVEVIGMLDVGDSVYFNLTASELFINNFNRPVPDSLDAQSNMKIEIACLKQVSQAEYDAELLVKRKEFMESQLDSAQLASDVAVLNEYYERNNLNPEFTENGIGYIVHEVGSGPKPKLGQLVKVDYSGYVLDGEYFDSSVKVVAQEKGLYDERREPYGPYPFEIYKGPVILGWHEGISVLNEGSKATLYIPSPLGYGARTRSEVIQANYILVFDVELVEVVD
ncbi:MAG: FKBP-type peptidyl-prolyl cis-trans isomerase [Bacteroidota bacterium]